MDATLSGVVLAPYIATNLEQLETNAEFVGKNFHNTRPPTKAIISNYVYLRTETEIESTARKQRET